MDSWYQSTRYTKTIRIAKTPWNKFHFLLISSKGDLLRWRKITKRATISDWILTNTEYRAQSESRRPLG